MQMKKAILRNSEIVFFFDKKIILWPTRRVFFSNPLYETDFFKVLTEKHKDEELSQLHIVHIVSLSMGKKLQIGNSKN